jgi:ubiquinone biosynthesis protein UbiJ
MTKTEGKRKRIKVSMTPREQLFVKLSKLNLTLGRLLAPKYESAGIAELLRAAQEAIVKAGTEHVQKLADEWEPVAKKVKPAKTPEQIKKIKERLEKLQAQLEAAEA